MRLAVLRRWREATVAIDAARRLGDAENALRQALAGRKDPREPVNALEAVERLSGVPATTNLKAASETANMTAYEAGDALQEVYLEGNLRRAGMLEWGAHRDARRPWLWNGHAEAPRRALVVVGARSRIAVFRWLAANAKTPPHERIKSR